jgi:hypothetical protein
MQIEVLVVPGCPNTSTVLDCVREAVERSAIAGIDVATTEISTLSEADRRGFVGSPTVLIDGHDPFADATLTPALACRIYLHEDTAAGIPDIALLVDAIRRVATSR